MSRTHLTQLHGLRPAILPSLLLCDFGNLAREVRALESAGVAGMHLDVMDGHFVPNLTYGMPIVEAVRRLTDLPLDVHLMIDQPDRYIEQFVSAGADIITVHVEAVHDPAQICAQIHAFGAAACLALNPPTPVSTVAPHLDDCDMVLVMSVMPGFGGQEFDPAALEKLRQLRELMGFDKPLEVDGGVNSQTIRDCAQNGADLFVVGSAIFRSDDYGASVDTLKRLAISR